MKNTLTRKQLIELHGKFDCTTWKTNISEILSSNVLKTDSDLIEIEPKYLLVLTKEGTDEQKKLVEKYGIKQSENIMVRVKTFEDALTIVGVKDEDEEELLNYSGKNDNILSSIAHLKLSIIAKALNEGWKPDWSNSNEYKYYPWFKNVGSGSGWVYVGYDGWYALSNIGSRLCVNTSEKAKYMGTQFIGLYNQMFKLS